MDDQTLARFKASGEKDLATFLSKQGAQNDLPPGVSGYSAGTQSFAGSTAAERGVAAPAPSFRDRLAEGVALLSGIPNAVRGVGENLGILAPSEPKPQQNVLTASGRTGGLEAGLDSLEARSTLITPPPGQIAVAAQIKPLLGPEDEAKKKQTDKILASREIGKNVLANASKLRSLGPENILDTLR